MTVIMLVILQMTFIILIEDLLVILLSFCYMPFSRVSFSRMPFYNTTLYKCRPPECNSTKFHFVQCQSDQCHSGESDYVVLLTASLQLCALLKSAIRLKSWHHLYWISVLCNSFFFLSKQSASNI